MATKKQVIARKRNFLLYRLSGAYNIFTLYNSSILTKEEKEQFFIIKKAINKLLIIWQRTTDGIKEL